MSRQYTNTDCPLHGSRYCSILNMLSCEECTVSAREKTVGIESVTTYIDALEKLMPEDGIAELFTGDNCVLCKSDEPNRKSGYALLDMGNAEPGGTRRNVLGIKTKLRTGAIIPVQFSCCSECRKRFLYIEYVRLAMVAACIAVMVLLMSVRPIFEAMKAVWMGLPAAVFVAGLAASIIAGTVVRSALIKKYSAFTHLDVFELPKLAQMQQKGWFQIGENRNNRFTKLVFTKKRIRQGVFTGNIQG